MRLRLVPAADDPKGYPDAALAHQSRNDGMQRPLAASEHIWAAGLESEQPPAILQRESCPRRNHARTERIVITLDVRNHVPLRIHDTEVSRVCAHGRRFARFDLAVSFRLVNKPGAFAGVIL